MKRLITRLVLAAALTVTLVASLPTAPAAAQGEQQVWAFYLGFWSNTGWNGAWLSDYPASGIYDARDPGTVGRQIGEAQSAGIDAFIINWYGLGDSQTTSAMNTMLDAAASRGFRAAVAVDVYNPNQNRNIEQLRASLSHIINNRANHPAYLRYEGKPVIVFAFQERSGLSTSQWLALRNELDPGRRTLWIAEGLSGCCLYGGAMDGMYPFNIAWSNGNASRYVQEANLVEGRGGMYVPTVHPGWDESLIAAAQGRPNPTSPRDRAGGAFLTNTWNAAMATDPNVVMIVSWNEYYENSHIEPSQAYGAQSLDTLRGLIAAWKSGAAGVPAGSTDPAVPPSSPTGRVLESTVTLNVRSGPSTGEAILGRINPGTQYAVLQQLGRWYQIDFNGTPGWVYGPLTRVTETGDTGSAAPAPAPGGRTLESWTTLNVRTGPSTSNAILGQIRPGTRYAITGESGGWYAIDFNGRTGYVSGAYVRTYGG